MNEAIIKQSCTNGLLQDDAKEVHIFAKLMLLN